MPFRRRRAPEPPRPPELAPLSLEDAQWRSSQLEIARSLGERYLDRSELPPSLSSLDAVIDAWFADDDARVEVNTLVNGVGITLGHHLVKAVDLTWVIATDEAGSDLALHRPVGDVLIYPCRLVAERVVADERDFVEVMFDDLVTSIRAT